MAINQLTAAYEAAQKLPLKYQDIIAEKILEEIEEAQWDEWLAQPEISEMMDELEAKAKAQHLAGKTKNTFQEKALQNFFKG
jgi:hypothetical protein